ncbi:beta-N-acetylhexosaminidase [Acetobacter estunensis]|nr:family 20 glycosylhydrolase [Acetobacter estunensis]
MKRGCIVGVLALVASGVVFPFAAEATDTGRYPLMPFPSSVTWKGGTAAPCARVEVTWATAPTPLLRRAAVRFDHRVSALAKSGAVCSLSVRYAPDAGWLTVAAREHYRLEMTGRHATLEADGPAGVLRGLATVLQFRASSDGGVEFPAAVFDDAPRFAWRGIVIDPVRHFLSVTTIERQLDAMELAKLNVLHLHLSDGTAFRVESHRFPRLQQVASHDRYFTQADIRHLVAFAADRGIRVVPEFDVPGHARAILEAYPELAARPETVATGNPNNPALDVTNPRTLAFVKTLFSEMVPLFPDAYFHAGGDEVVASQWTGSPRIAAWMQTHGYRDAAALQAVFTEQVRQVLTSLDRTMIGWDEVMTAPVPRSVAVEVWRASKWTGEATATGHPTIVAAGYYLDLLRPARQSYEVDPFDVKAEGMSAAELAAAQRKHFPHAEAFAMDPQARALDAEQERHVLGGEMPLWTEEVSEPMLDGRLWPRAAAIAERLWSPASVRGVTDMERRLPLVEDELERLGLRTQHERTAMMAGLAGTDVEPVRTLLDMTSPIRNYGINRMAKTAGEALLTWPVAIAVPDNAAALHFNALALAYARGERSVRPELEAVLVKWATNDAAFASVAERSQALMDVRPISRQLSQLASVSLKALRGETDAGWRMDAERLLAGQAEALASCSWNVLPGPGVPPAGGLLIDIVPGVRALVQGVR